MKTDIRDGSLLGGTQYSERKDNCLNTILKDKSLSSSRTAKKKMTLHSLHQKKPTGTMAWNNGMTLSSELLAMEEKPHSGMTAIIILPPNLYHFTALPTSDWPGDRLEYQRYRRMKKGASKEVK